MCFVSNETSRVDIIGQRDSLKKFGQRSSNDDFWWFRYWGGSQIHLNDFAIEFTQKVSRRRRELNTSEKVDEIGLFPNPPNRRWKSLSLKSATACFRKEINWELHKQSDWIRFAQIDLREKIWFPSPNNSQFKLIAIHWQSYEDQELNVSHKEFE
jgi:hypothetical protein